MQSLNSPDAAWTDLLKQIQAMRKTIRGIDRVRRTSFSDPAWARLFVKVSGELAGELHGLRELISPIRFGPIGITLGRSDSIAKFFAFSFTHQTKLPLDQLLEKPFYGAGVYAIYYHGRKEKAYRPLSGTETPIYVGKANPKNPQAETVEEQGQALFLRLKEHVQNMQRTDLALGDFRFRAVPIQTGMQAAVEDFMIRLFRPIWNKEIKICYGIGKHGDDAETRKNKRSPWDTMHPGRRWAAATRADQKSRQEIKAQITKHFATHPIIANKDQLFQLLSLK